MRLMMMSGQKAPPGHFRNQIQWNRLVVGQLPGAFTCFVAGKLICEVLDGLVAGINAKMIFESGKVDDVLLAPVRWHPP